MATTREPRVIRLTNAESAIFPDLHRIITCEERVEEAVHFLAKALGERPSRGKKPVLLHSLRVGFFLLAFKCPTDVVIAGMLHDLMEKTPISAGHVRAKFGARVALMVLAATNDPRIRDALDRYEDSVLRCAEAGEGALLVRAADLIDNTDRALRAEQISRLERVLEKLRVLIRVCRAEGLDDRVLVELVKRQRKVQRLVSASAPAVSHVTQSKRVGGHGGVLRRFRR